MLNQPLEQRQQKKEHEHDESKGKRLIFHVYEGHNSKQTADKYRTDFKLFLDYIKIHDYDVLLDLGKEALQELVIKYTRSLRDNPDKKYSRSTVQNRIACIIYFFENNDVELNKRKIRRYLPPDESVNDDRFYTVDEIKTLQSVCDLRTWAMVLLMASSGMRIGALHLLRIGDLYKIESEGVYKIQVYARTHDRYYTFCTPECAKVIKEYLDYRARSGEILKDESPLFRRMFSRFSINKPLPISQPSVMEVIDLALAKSGVRTKQVMRSHAFRKRFKTVCEQAGMKSINVELLLGHSIGVSNSYYRPLESDVLNDYMTHAAEALTIDSSQRLRQENQELRKNQNEYLAELGELREDFNQMKQLLVHLSKDSQKQLVDDFYQKVADKADIEWSCD